MCQHKDITPDLTGANCEIIYCARVVPQLKPSPTPLSVFVLGSMVQFSGECVVMINASSLERGS